MKDISELIKRDESDAPKYLLGHSLGGLMTIYYAMTRDAILNGLITICKEFEFNHASLISFLFAFSSCNWNQ